MIQRHAHWIWRRDLRTQQWPPQGPAPGREGPPLQPRATRTIQTSASQTVRPTCLPRGNSSTACDLGAVPTSVFCLTAWPPSRLSHVASRSVTWPCAASRSVTWPRAASRGLAQRAMPPLSGPMNISNLAGASPELFLCLLLRLHLTGYLIKEYTARARKHARASTTHRGWREDQKCLRAEVKGPGGASSCHLHILRRSPNCSLP